jgi:hypothetical protein
MLTFALYQYALLLYLPSAILGFYYDWRYRGAPFKVFIPGAIGGVMMLYYVLSYVPQLWLIYAAQIAALSACGVSLFVSKLAGNDDMLWMITLSMIFFGASFVFVVGAIILFIHLIYRRINKLHDNPYSDRYSRFYPYPMVAYMGVGVVMYMLFSLFFSLPVPLHLFGRN